MTQVGQRNRDWLVIVGVNLTATLWLFWQHYKGQTTAETTLIAAPIVLVVLNSVMLRGIRAKNRRQQLDTPTSLIVTAILLACAATGSLWAAFHGGLGGNELMNEVVSSKPLTAIRPERKAILVQLLRTRLQNSRDYDVAVLQIKPTPPPLYSAQSFENDTVMQAVMSHVQKVASLDISYAEKQQDAMNEFRTRMSKADPAYLQSFEAELPGRVDEYGQMASLEKEWLKATSDLYDFVGANYGKIRLNKDQLAFSDPNVKANFDDKKKCATDLWNKILATEKEQAERQKKALGGVSASKWGLTGD